MGMRIGGGSAPSPVVSQSSVAQWQQSQAVKSPASQVQSAAPAPTETKGKSVNVYA